MKYIVLLLLLCKIAAAQEKDIACINYSASAITHNDTTAHAGLLDMKLRLPVYDNGKYTIITALNYKNLSVDGFPEHYGTGLQALSNQAIFRIKFSETRSLALIAQVGLFSDFKAVSGDDFRYGLGFNYSIRHSERLTTGWGLFYARQFFGNQIVPFISFDYQPGKRWTISGQFPVKEKVLYLISKTVSVGLEIAGDNNSYRLSEGQSQGNYVKVTQWAALGKFEYAFAKSWRLNAGIGSNFVQNYALFPDSSSTSWTIITAPLGKKPQPLEQVKSKGFAAQIGISYSPF